MFCGAGCAAFHFSTLEEYYTGGLFLGPLNGISDGSLGVILANIFVALFGNEMFALKVSDSMRVIDYVIYPATIASLGVVVMR